MRARRTNTKVLLIWSLLGCAAGKPGDKIVYVDTNGKSKVLSDDVGVHRIAGTDDIPFPAPYRAAYDSKYSTGAVGGVGTVAIEYCVGVDGKVTSVKVTTPKDPPSDFAAYYEHALNAWEFEPYTVSGVATPFCANYLLRYTFLKF